MAVPAWAKPGTQNKYASIIIDADSLEILHARKIDGARYPASLTKMMTLYLVFDALERGDITLHEKLSVSRRAARTPAVRLGLKAGATITTEQAIQALAVRSANDIAVVLAERLGGSEAEFAQAMTLKAHALGMQSTTFKNAHGLPNPGQISTARDLAKLADALLRTHPKYYHYFSTRTFTYNGRTYTNHNTLLGKVEGVDGFKTGFTNASGYNLILSSRRDGRRIIAVVLGGASGKSRDQHMTDLIERGFEVLGQETRGSFALNADESSKKTRVVLPPPDRVHAYTLRASAGSAKNTVRIVQGAGASDVPVLQTKGWAVQIGAFGTALQAQSANQALQEDRPLGLALATPQIIPVPRTSGFLYRARLSGLTLSHAQIVCKTLVRSGQSCLVIAPN